MRHCFAIVLGALLLGPPALATAQYPVPLPGNPRARAGSGLSGRYLNPESGGFCYIYRTGRGFLFVDEAVQRVLFVYNGPGRLRSVPMNGMNVPEIHVQVGHNTDGRLVLTFYDGGGVAVGEWIAIY
jgi:hypothetical protein